MDIIFDLDGTLIDSSDGILKAVKLAFERCNVEMKQPLSSKLIGPPLNELLVMLSGTYDENVLNKLSIAFKEGYDSDGYKDTTVFEGVETLMQRLKEQGHSLYIATNKRIIPTRKIIDFLKWDHLFEEVYALDLFSHTNNKGDLIAHIIKLHDMKKDSTLYIGDTVADHRAAISNEILYMMAMWGYDSDSFQEGISAFKPSHLIEYIKNQEISLF